MKHRDPVSSNPFISMSKGVSGGGSKSPQPPFVDPMLTVSSPDVMAAFFAQQLAQHAANSAMPVVSTPAAAQAVRRGPGGGGGLSLPLAALVNNHSNGSDNPAQQQHQHRQRGGSDEDSSATKSAPNATLDYRAAATGGAVVVVGDNNNNGANGGGQKPQPRNQQQPSAPSYQQHHHADRSGATGAATMPLMSLSALEKGELLTRTIHLRFLPTEMKQGDLAAMCNDCGPVLRVRICGGQNHVTHTWIYGFVEFANTAAAYRMMRKSGMELYNGPSKPPLHLKCHFAREPIVDRVFHDADPAKKLPCQFGHGAFAQRTLREALDSYFSLVSKSGVAKVLKDELQQQKQQKPLPLKTAMPQQPQQQHPSDPTVSDSALSCGTTGGGGDVGDGSSLGSIAWSQLPVALSPKVVVGGGGKSFSVDSSTASSVNGRTASDPPSPQPATFHQHGAIGTPTSYSSAAPAAAAASTAAATASFALPPSLVGSVASASTPTSQYPLRSGLHSDYYASVVNKCLGLLDAAMHSGAEFASVGNEAKFYCAMQSLQALHETVHGIQSHRQAKTTMDTSSSGGRTTSPGLSLTEYSSITAAFAATTTNGGSTTTPPSAPGAGDAAAAAQSDELRFENDIRCIRISAFLIASFLHILRGSLSDMLPCITRALDIIAEVPMAAIPKPADLELGHEDDEEAFLSALSLVHVVQPAVLASREIHDNAVRHQEFLCNALMALGFGVEDVNSLIARCAYTAARRRAHSALGISNAVLDQALTQGGVHKLRFVLGGLVPVNVASGKESEDATVDARHGGGDGPLSPSSFVYRFFATYGGPAVAKSSLARSPGGTSPPLQHQSSLAMEELPPLHCARVFSQRAG